MRISINAENGAIKIEIEEQGKIIRKTLDRGEAELIAGMLKTASASNKFSFTVVVEK